MQSEGGNERYLPLSPLERACLKLVAEYNWPTIQLDGVKVIRREYTGVGVYIYLEDLSGQCVSDGEYGPALGELSKWRTYDLV